MEETFQTFSSFTTNYLPAQDYESILVSASKIRGQSVRNFDRRDRLENDIVRFVSRFRYSLSNSRVEEHKWLIRLL